MAYATGRCMCHAILKQPFDVDPVVDKVRHVYAGRAVFHCGCSSVAPGLDLHWVGGHSDGLQIVRVQTARGSVVLASDAAHYYANMRKKNPFPLVYNVGDMVHDPAVADLFPMMKLKGVDAFVLHERPSERAWKHFAAA